MKTAPLKLSERVHRAGQPPISYLMKQAVTNPDVISLAAGLVDNESLPVSQVREAAAAILGDDRRGKEALQYGTTPGDERLRRLIADHLSRLEGGAPVVDESRIVVTTGSQQSLYLISEVLLDPGDIVILGVPAYFVYMGVLDSLGAQVVGVPTDQDGLRPDDLDDALAGLSQAGKLDRVKLVYDPTYFNNPTGLSLGAGRRGKVLDVVRRWSKHHRIHFLEDAAYRELRYDGADVPSVFGLDETEHSVVYAGTFSKPFSPGLKCGYVALPDDLVEPVINQKGHHDFGSANLIQQILAEVIERGGYAEQVERLRKIYRVKRDTMLSVLDEELGELSDQVVWTKPEGGLYVWLQLPSHIATDRDGAFFARCLESGVLYVPGEFCYPRTYSERPRSCLRLSFGVQSPDRIREGMRRLCGVVRKVLAPLGTAADPSG